MTLNGTSAVHSAPALRSRRAAGVDWVDYAKGFCIVMVVMMHSTLGVEAAAGQTASCMRWSPSRSRSGCPTSS